MCTIFVRTTIQPSLKRYKTSCTLYDNLQKKYSLMHQIRLCDKVLSKTYQQALEVCDTKQSIELQPMCKRLWNSLESYAIVKNELQRKLNEVDELLGLDYNDLN